MSVDYETVNVWLVESTSAGTIQVAGLSSFQLLICRGSKISNVVYRVDST